MTRLARQILALSPPHGLVNDTVVANLYPALSTGALHALLHRAVASGELLRLRRGLYCLAAPLRRSTPHPFVVAAAILSPSHVSLETALWFHGLIPEATREVASVIIERSRRFTTPLGTFSFATVKALEPRAGVTAIEIERGAWSFVAEPLRALADLVYLRPEVTWERDGPRFALESLRLEREALTGVSWKRCGEICASLRNRRVVDYLQGLRKELGR